LTFISCAPSASSLRLQIEEEVRGKYKEELKREALVEVEKDKEGFQEYVEKKKKLNNLDVIPLDGESKLDALIRERQETKGEIGKTKQDIISKQKLIEEGESKVRALDAAIKQAEQDRMKFFANVIGGLSALFAIILAVASILTSGYPLLPKVLRYISIGFASLSILAFGFAAIIAYLTIIGIILGIILISSGLYFWFKDRKSLTQVVETVETVKHKIPRYKEKFNQMIDSDVDVHVNKMRENLKNKKNLNKKGP
jgi:hypothetical protein